jgi:hypothetical protein
MSQEHSLRCHKPLRPVRGGSEIDAADNGNRPIDCLDLAQAMIDSPGIPNREKVPLIAILAQYTHVKPVGQYLSRSIVFEPPKTIDEALELRRKFMAMKYRRELTVEEADGLIADIDGHISQMRGPDHTQRIEAIEQRLAAQDAAPEIAVIVEGGLGALPVGPGEPTVIMPSHVRLVEAKEEEQPDDGQSGGPRESDRGAGDAGGPESGEDQAPGRDEQG